MESYFLKLLQKNFRIMSYVCVAMGVLFTINSCAIYPPDHNHYNKGGNNPEKKKLCSKECKNIGMQMGAMVFSNYKTACVCETRRKRSRKTGATSVNARGAVVALLQETQKKMKNQSGEQSNYYYQDNDNYLDPYNYQNYQGY